MPGTGGDGPRPLLAALERLLVTTASARAEVCDLLAEGLLAAFEADRGLVFLPDPGGDLELVSTRAAAPDQETGEPVSRNLLAKVAGERVPILLTAARTEALRKEISSIHVDLRSIIAAPLELERGVGVVYLDCRTARRKYDAEDEALLLAFARAAGAAIDGVRQRNRAERRSQAFAEVQRRGLLEEPLLGTSAAMQAVRADLAQAARTDVTVLITGESGTGKELAARALHAAGDRSGGPFVAVNCPALPISMIEGELFGAAAGAYSGAEASRPGRIELADGGTLFLDEVGDLSLEAQGKLLRVLEDRQVTRLGEAAAREVDFRLVAATNLDLERRVEDGLFRQDLYFRLAVFCVPLPPLAARGEDVLVLAVAFLETLSREYGKARRILSEEARAALLGHPWPGNIRELSNLLRRAVIRSRAELLSGAEIAEALAPHAIARPTSAFETLPDDLAEARRAFDAAFLEQRLARYGGEVTATARALGISRNTLYVKCRDLGIDLDRFRDAAPPGPATPETAAGPGKD